MPKADRRLVPILSVDIAGSSRLIEFDDAGALRLLKAMFDGIVGPQIAAFGGSVFKMMGDGLLAEFSSVVAAVECVASVQQKLANEPLAGPGGDKLQLRAAIVLGDVLVSSDDRYGVAVNMAVRMQEYAPPGGMAISKWMNEYLAGKVSLSFTDIGSRRLKNLSQNIHIFVWHPDPAVQQALGAEYAAERSSSNMEEGRPSLVVLPFANLSPDREHEYFVDAVVDEITATLSRIGDFTVIARNSAFAYKGRAIDVRQIGRELGVRYVLEGSVQRSGDRIRITAQLVEAATGTHIWVGKAEGKTADIFDLQDRVAETVAGNVYPSLRKAEIDRARKKRPDNLVAYDLVMRALPHLWAHRMHENPEAIALLNRALALDPVYGLAAALCAWAHAQQIVYNWTSDSQAERAKGLALTEVAARHVGDDPTGLTALATAIMLLEGNARRALGFVNKALLIDPNHAWAWMRKGFGLIYTGEPEQALEAFARAERLSPLDPFTFNIHIGIGLAHFSAGRPAEAARYPQMVLDEKPGLTWPYRDLAVYRAHAGDLAGARDALEHFVYLRPAMTLATMAADLRFMDDALRDRYLEGLRLAGLQ